MFSLTGIILQACLVFEFVGVIIHGPYGWGKSVYAAKVLSEVYSKFGVPNWDISMLKEYMKFHPINVVDYWAQRELENRGRGRAFCWDDAGFWLFALNWQDPMIKDLARYVSNTARTAWGALLLTTPKKSWITAKIRGMPRMITVKISKVYASNDEAWILADDGKTKAMQRKHLRLATGYEGWESPDGHKDGVHKIFKDYFSVMMPDHAYAWYQPERDKYSKTGVLSMKHKFDQIRKDPKNKGKTIWSEDLESLEKELVDIQKKHKRHRRRINWNA